jgi:hypothetical protein
VFNDDFNVSMSTLNYSGLIIASKAIETDLDKYEEEEDDDLDMDNEKEAKNSKKNSHIIFKPFNEHKNLKDWHFELKDGESVDCLAIGAGWVTALTDFGYLRVFSADGI